MNRTTLRLGFAACTLFIQPALMTLAFAQSSDGGIAGLQGSVQARIVHLSATPSVQMRLPQPAADASADIAALLQTPLSSDNAVRVALLNNPKLQAAMGAAGINISDNTRADNADKRRLGLEVAKLSAQASRDWVNAVTAEQSAQVLKIAKETAETTGELSRRMVQAGNTPKLAQARTQLTLSEATVALARAQQQAWSAREALIVTLGLWGPQTLFKLPATLPALPAQAADVPNLEARALEGHTELALSRLAWQLKSTSPATSADERWDALGDAAQVRGASVAVRSQARDAYFSFRTAWDIAHHLQTEVLPLRTLVNDEMVLRYNGMLTSLFDVLADSMAGTLAANAALEAQRDFWLAHIDLQALLAGVPYEGSRASASATKGGGGPAAAAH